MGLPLLQHKPGVPYLEHLVCALRSTDQVLRRSFKEPLWIACVGLFSSRMLFQ